MKVRAMKKKKNTMNRNNLARSKKWNDYMTSLREFIASPDGENWKRRREFFKKHRRHQLLHGRKR